MPEKLTARVGLTDIGWVWTVYDAAGEACAYSARAFPTEAAVRADLLAFVNATVAGCGRETGAFCADTGEFLNDAS